MIKTTERKRDSGSWEGQDEGGERLAGAGSAERRGRGRGAGYAALAGGRQQTSALAPLPRRLGLAWGKE